MLQALSVRNLSGSLENIQELELKKKAINTVKYQNFKTRVALEKMDTPMTEIMFSAGVSYIKYGTINKALGKAFKIQLDKAIEEHVQPLVPREEEKRLSYMYHRGTRLKTKKQVEAQKKETELPIQKLEVVKNPLTETFEYGVMVDKNLRIFDTEDEAKQFMYNLRFFCDKDMKLVEVKINEVK